MGALQQYRWPGNVRELYNVLESAIIQARKPVVELSDLSLECCASNECDAPPRFQAGLTLAELEREAIQQCLNQTVGNRPAAARLLGISTRALAGKMCRHGIHIPCSLGAAKPRPLSGARSGSALALSRESKCLASLR
jgi:DNA-binding NtrC family response regulator